MNFNLFECEQRFVVAAYEDACSRMDVILHLLENAVASERFRCFQNKFLTVLSHMIDNHAEITTVLSKPKMSCNKYAATDTLLLSSIIPVSLGARD